MGTAVLTIDLSALRANWQALNAKSAGITAAVVKADGYGLDSARVATALAAEGAQHFFRGRRGRRRGAAQSVGQRPQYQRIFWPYGAGYRFNQRGKFDPDG